MILNHKTKLFDQKMTINIILFSYFKYITTIIFFSIISTYIFLVLILTEERINQNNK